MSRTGTIGRLVALILTMAAGTVTGGCGGAGDRRASEPSAAPGEDSAGPELDAECCCQRYDEDGNATGANISDQTACKSTGGTCTQDETQCENE